MSGKTDAGGGVRRAVRRASRRRRDRAAEREGTVFRKERRSGSERTSVL